MKRGILVTDYIDCGHCLNRVKEAIRYKCSSLELEENYYEDWDKRTLLAMGVSAKEDYADTEVGEVQSVLVPILERQLCHVVRVAVFSANFELVTMICPLTDEELKEENSEMKVVGEGKT